MKRILLMSDTHSYYDERMLHYSEKHDEIWHAGDWGDVNVYDKLSVVRPVKGVYGNIDELEVKQVCPLNQLFECEQVLVLMTHIAGYPGRYKPRVLELIKKHRPKLVIAGHSHILKVMYDKNLEHLHMNPGAIGQHGFQTNRTMLSFEINGADIANLNVIEFEK
jgi:putative phosphoesterase